MVKRWFQSNRNVATFLPRRGSAWSSDSPEQNHQNTPTPFQPRTCCSTCIGSHLCHCGPGKRVLRVGLRSRWDSLIGPTVLIQVAHRTLLPPHCGHAHSVGGRPLTPTLTQEVWSQTDVSKHAGGWQVSRLWRTDLIPPSLLNQCSWHVLAAALKSAASSLYILFLHFVLTFLLHCRCCWNDANLNKIQSNWILLSYKWNGDTKGRVMSKDISTHRSIPIQSSFKENVSVSYSTHLLI